MQNLLLGSSGAGKSYEACVYQILPAVQRGRKVITNMPLVLEAWAALDPRYLDLIELRKKPQPIRGTWEPTREEGAFHVRPEQFWSEPPKMSRVFAGVWDYYDEWRHPTTGQGALFVIDEAQNVIPYKGTDTAVEEWTALHRHWFNDVLWITQSYGKLSRAVIDNLQMVYRCRKKTAWGQPNKYIRKVQDGIRGEVMNVDSDREYESKYFSLYKSHTQTDSTGHEAGADDVRSIWQHWSFRGMALMAVIFVVMLISGYIKNPFKPAIKKPHQAQLSKPAHVASRPVIETVKQALPELPKKEEKPKLEDPFGSFGVHLVGSITFHGQTKAFYVLSQNGQKLRELTQGDIEQAGYKVTHLSTCLSEITFGVQHRMVYCDAPTATAGVGGEVPQRSQPYSG